MNAPTRAEKRRQTKADIEDTVLVRLYRRMALRRQGFRCLYCFRPLSFGRETGDHLVPRSRGGETTLDNVKAACFRCNQVKGAMHWRDFVVAILSPDHAPLTPLWHIAMDRWFWSRTWRACERIAVQVGMDAVPSVVTAHEGDAP